MDGKREETNTGNNQIACHLTNLLHFVFRYPTQEDIIEINTTDSRERYNDQRKHIRETTASTGAPKGGNQTAQRKQGTD